MKKYLVAIGLITALVSCSTKEKNKQTSESINTQENTMKNTIYGYSYEGPNGEEKSFEDHKGNVILIVNTATQCGLTPQFEELEMLHKNYSGVGLKVIGFPCNQFGGQEPKSDEDMVAFCKANHGVTFELAKKIRVNGEEETELYNFLKSQQKIEDNNDIRWNFEKFLVNKKGEVVKRYSPKTTPTEIMKEIEVLLKS